MAKKKNQKSKNSTQKILLYLVLLTGIALSLTLILKPKKIYAPTVATNAAPAPELPKDWKTYTIPGVLSFQYPPDYSTFANGGTNYPGIDVYDKKEHLGPANTYLSITTYLNGLKSYETDYNDYRSNPRRESQMKMLSDGFSLTFKDEKGYAYQVERHFKLKNGYIRAYYRSAPEIPSETYDKIISSIKILE